MNGVDFCQAINLSGFDVKSNLRQMAALCRIFILQQIKIEKNGFHRLLDWEIGFKNADFLSDLIIWCRIMLIFVKLLIQQVLMSDQIRGKWPLFTESSFFSKSSLRKTVFTDF